MSRQLRPSPNCLNCGQPVASRFCSECGQENTNYKVSLGRLLGDLFEELFQLESRLWRTLWDLVRRPGRLTLAYNSGQRVRYTTPLRLYLLASIAYFFTAAVVPPRPGGAQIKADLGDADLSELPPPKSAFDKRIRERLGIYKKLDVAEATKRAREAVLNNTPRAMVVLLPIFALLVMMLFWGHYFVEHLVFALHVHAFAFLLLTLSELTRNSAVDALALFVAWLWTLVALRRVYKRSWGQTFWKLLLLSFLYLIAVSFGILGALLAGLLLF